MACGKCAINKDEECSIKSDNINKWIQTQKSGYWYYFRLTSVYVWHCRFNEMLFRQGFLCLRE